MTADQPISAPRERPILFKGRLVRAILEGRKTQTRRPLNPQPPAAIMQPAPGLYFQKPCPYGAPGDRLWVREAWAIEDCGSRVSLKPEAWPKGWPIDRVRYIATDKAPATNARSDGRWWNSRSPLFMPRWASRIDLEVTEVRVQRLQDISEEDAIAEGARWTDAAVVFHESKLNEALSATARGAFAVLWDSINYARGFGWAANPWVWRIAFRRVRP